MRDCHREIARWMEPLGAHVSVDPAGNFRGIYPGIQPNSPHLLIGSHLDTVPNAGAYDGILGVVLAVALLEELHGRRLPFAIEVVGFSEEEGVRFGTPFIGSRALVGRLDDELLGTPDARGTSVRKAIQAYGLNPKAIPEAAIQGDALGYIEFHIEQGPVLEQLNLPLAAVEGIAGQSRLEFTFLGHANHAGTTPMHLRRDAIAGAAEWIGVAERLAVESPGLVATVGKIEAKPGATNVIAGEARLTLDVRHISDEIRARAVEDLVREAQRIAARRRIVGTGESSDEPGCRSHGPILDGGDRTGHRQGGMHAAPDGEWRRSRCDDPGGEGSKRDDLSSHAGRDQSRSCGISLAG